MTAICASRRARSSSNPSRIAFSSFSDHVTFGMDQSEYAGDVSNYGEETADAGTSTFERERDLSLENNIRDILGKIARAIGRLDDGTFGVCERCGKPIEKARVKALPYVELCIKDAQAESRQR